MKERVPQKVRLRMVSGDGGTDEYSETGAVVEEWLAKAAGMLDSLNVRRIVEDNLF